VEDRSKVGKPLGIDLKERKVTLPLSRLLQVADGAQRANVLAMLNKPEIEDEDVLDVVALMREHAVLPYTLGEARKYVERAKGHLDGHSALRQSVPLTVLADFVVEREL
jgi:octaprenyl-diphosphate synthase